MTPFAPREICKTPHSMYARMPQAMAQFVPNLKKKCLISKGQPQYYKQLEIWQEIYRSNDPASLVTQLRKPPW